MNRFFLFILLIASFSLFAQDTPVQSENVVGARFETYSIEEMDKQSQFVAANQQLLLGDFDKAIELLDKFLYLNDDEDAAWFSLAKAYGAKKEYEKALQSIGKAATIDPNNQWYQIFYANLLEQVGRAKDAVGIYENLVRQYPNVEEYYHTLGYLYVLSNDAEKGLAAYDAAEKKFGISPEIVDKKNLIYSASGDLKNAGKELEKLCAAFPSDVSYKLRLAQFYVTTNNTKAAESVYQNILVLDPDNAEARLALTTKSSAGATSNDSALTDFIADPRADIDAKIKKLLPAVTKLQENPTTENSASLIKMADLLEKAHPNNPKAWSFSGDVHYLSGQDAIALEKYQTCIKLNPSVFSVWENTLQILYELGNFVALSKTAEDAVDAFPNQAKAYYFYGFAKNKTKQSDDALPMLMQARLMVGDDPMLSLDLLDQIGLAQLQLEQLEGAEKTLQEALDNSKNQHPGALEHYGDLLYKKGKTKEAISFWEKAQKINPNTELEQKIGGRVSD